VRSSSNRLTDDGGESEPKCLLNLCLVFSGLMLFLSFLFPFLKCIDVPSSVCSVQSDWGMCVASAAKGSERGCNSERLDHQLSAP
jgi:hypothetical protein